MILQKERIMLYLFLFGGYRGKGTGLVDDEKEDGLTSNEKLSLCCGVVTVTTVWYIVFTRGVAERAVIAPKILFVPGLQLQLLFCFCILAGPRSFETYSPERSGKIVIAMATARI
jgi:hypothetical protein